MSLDSRIRDGLADAALRGSPSVDEALGEVLRRGRRRQFGRRIAGAVAAVAVLAGAVVTAGVIRAAQDEPSVDVRTDRARDTPARLRNDEAAISVALPRHWRKLGPTPETTPVEVLAYGSAQRAAQGPVGTCTTTPTGAALVGIYEYAPGTMVYASPDGVPLTGLPPSPRPEHFGVATRRATYQCAVQNTDPDASRGLATGVDAEFYLFTEQDRTLLAVVGFASGAPAERVARARKSLDTLRVGPRLQPLAPVPADPTRVALKPDGCPVPQPLPPDGNPRASAIDAVERYAAAHGTELEVLDAYPAQRPAPPEHEYAATPFGQCDVVADRTWVVETHIPKFEPSASVSYVQYFVARFEDGWKVWGAY